MNRKTRSAGSRNAALAKAEQRRRQAKRPWVSNQKRHEL